MEGSILICDYSKVSKAIKSCKQDILDNMEFTNEIELHKALQDEIIKNGLEPLKTLCEREINWVTWEHSKYANVLEVYVGLNGNIHYLTICHDGIDGSSLFGGILEKYDEIVTILNQEFHSIDIQRLKKSLLQVGIDFNQKMDYSVVIAARVFLIDEIHKMLENYEWDLIYSVGNSRTFEAFR